MPVTLRTWRRFWGLLALSLGGFGLLWMGSVQEGTFAQSLGASTLFLMSFTAAGTALLPRLPPIGAMLLGALGYPLAGLIFSLWFVLLRAGPPLTLLHDPISRHNLIWVALTWPLHLVALLTQTPAGR